MGEGAGEVVRGDFPHGVQRQCRCVNWGQEGGCVDEGGAGPGGCVRVCVWGRAARSRGPHENRPVTSAALHPRPPLLPCTPSQHSKRTPQLGTTSPASSLWSWRASQGARGRLLGSPGAQAQAGRGVSVIGRTAELQAATLPVRVPAALSILLRLHLSCRCGPTPAGRLEVDTGGGFLTV